METASKAMAADVAKNQLTSLFGYNTHQLTYGKKNESVPASKIIQVMEKGAEYFQKMAERQKN